jgi:hypothetical protein
VLKDQRGAFMTIAHRGEQPLPEELRNVDLDAGTIRLDAGITKNDEGRIVYMTPEIKALLSARVARVRTLKLATRPDHPVPVSASHRRARGPADRRLSEGVGDRLPEGRRVRTLTPTTFDARLCATWSMLASLNAWP